MARGWAGVKLGVYKAGVGRVFRIIAGGSSLLLASGAVAAAIAGLGASGSPKLDIINHFAPIWLVGGLAALLFALPLGRSRLRPPTIAVALLAIGLNGARVAPEFAQRISLGPAPAAAAERLKIIQFNTYVFNTTPQRAVDWLIAQQADVIVIEEGGGLRREGQLRLLKAYPHCSGCLANGDWSNLILSKRPSLAQGRFEERGLSAVQGGWSRFAGAGGEFTVAGVHLAWPWLPSAPPQHLALAEFVARQPKDRLIVAGDFNMTPWSHGLRQMDGRLGLDRLTHGQGSWPAGPYHKIPSLPLLPVPYMAIDQVYAGGGWRAVEVRRGPKLGSDHYPIIVELVAVRPRGPRP